MRCAALVAVLLTACAGPDDAAQSAAPPDRELFPTPARGLTFPSAPGAPSDLATLLEAFSACTGWTLLAAPWPGELADRQLHDVVRQIPPAEVYRFVEAQLVEHGYVFTVASARAPRLLGVHPFRDASAADVLANAPFVTEEELADWRTHPAFVVRVALQFDQPETLTLAHHLRDAVSDQETRQVVVIEGSRAVLIAGRADWVGEQRDLLRAILAR